MVLFGGVSGFHSLDDTWAYNLNGNAWTNKSPALAPSGGSTAYDSQSDRIIMFGGKTWAYDLDSNTWTDMNPVVAPSPRGSFSIAYDAQSDRVIIFGGRYSDPNNETWAYDFNSNTWTNMSPPTSPPVSYGHSMVYDSRADRMVVYIPAAQLSWVFETWAYNYDTNTWTNMTSASHPHFGANYGMAYDTQSDRVVVFGGNFVPSNTYAYDYDNNTWTDLDPPTQPSSRQEFDMAYDLQSDRIVLFGGSGGGVVEDDTWAYDFDTNTWVNMSRPTPSARQSHAMSYDSGLDRVVLFGGGVDTYVNSPETWSYDVDGDKWTNMSPTSGPSARWSPRMAFDSQSGRTILFGGNDGLLKDDTWAYDLDANTWTNMNPSTKPSGRSKSALAYDSQSDRAILFGGFDGAKDDETWAYDFDSNTWTNMNPATKPSARNGHAMAYDSQSDRVILFGGSVAGSYSDETWAYDFNSNAWTNMSPSTKPSARFDHAMAYDVQIDRMMLFGGYDASFEDDETWSYDFNSNTWSKLNPIAKPSPRSGHAMAFDSQSSHMVLFGGWDGAYDGGTWLYNSATEPSAPFALQATPHSGQVVLQWQPPSYDGGAPVFGYTIYRGTSSGNLPFLTSVGNVLTYTDTGLTNGITYYYAVTAVNSVNESLRSNEASATPVAPTIPPLNVLIDANQTSGSSPLVVSFTCSEQGGVGPYSYSWDFDDGNTSTTQNPIHTFDSAGDYEVTVTVTDSLGNSTSESIEITVGGGGGSGGFSWLPIAIAGIIAAVVVGVILILLMHRRGRSAPVAPTQEPQAQGEPAAQAAFCTDCGSSIPSGSGFCTNCGKKL